MRRTLESGIGDQELYSLLMYILTPMLFARMLIFWPQACIWYIRVYVQWKKRHLLLWTAIILIQARCPSALCMFRQLYFSASTWYYKLKLMQNWISHQITNLHTADYRECLDYEQSIIRHSINASSKVIPPQFSQYQRLCYETNNFDKSYRPKTILMRGAWLSTISNTLSLSNKYISLYNLLTRCKSPYGTFETYWSITNECIS